MLADFFSNLPGIIKESGATLLTLFALLVVGVVILALSFFRKAAIWIRVGAFLTLLTGVSIFGLVAVQSTKTTLERVGTPTPTVLGHTEPESTPLHWAEKPDQIRPLWTPIAYQVKNSRLATSFVPQENDTFLIAEAVGDTETMRKMLSVFKDSVNDPVLAKWFVALDTTSQRIWDDLWDVVGPNQIARALDFRAVLGLAPDKKKALQMAEYSRVELIGYIEQISRYLGASNMENDLDTKAKQVPESTTP